MYKTDHSAKLQTFGWMMRGIVLSLIISLILGVACARADGSVNPRLKHLVRLEDNVQQIVNELDALRSEMDSKGHSMILEKRIEAKERQLESLSGFLDRQRDILREQGIEYENIDREPIREEIRQLQEEFEERKREIKNMKFDSREQAREARMAGARAGRRYPGSRGDEYDISDPDVMPDMNLYERGEPDAYIPDMDAMNHDDIPRRQARGREL